LTTPEGMELATLTIDLQYKLADRAGDLTRNQINFLLSSVRKRMQAVEVSQLAERGVTRIVFNNDDQ